LTRSTESVAAPWWKTGSPDRSCLAAAAGEVSSPARTGDAGMSRSDEVFRRIQSTARAAATRTGTHAPTQEYLIRHTLESFLDRLTRTAHAEDFVLKGGILLAAYGVRRPTKDVDANAISADLTIDHLIT